MSGETHDAMTVHDVPEQQRYEAKIGREAAFIDYALEGDTIDLIHTEVPVGLEGQGIAGNLARFALDDARRRGLRVIPSCPYIAVYLRRHPEYQDIVVPESRDLKQAQG